MTVCSFKYVLVLFGFLVFTGCGSDANKIPIKGTVFLDSKPLDGASVAFVGNEGGAFSSAVSDAKGDFSMRAVPGKNKVAVIKQNTQNIKPPDPNVPQTMPTEAEYAVMVKSAPKGIVAERFGDPDKSGIVIDISSGMSSIDINVTSK